MAWPWELQISLSRWSLDDCLLLVFPEIPLRIGAAAFETISSPFSAVSVGDSFLEPVIQPQEGIQFLSPSSPSGHLLRITPWKAPVIKYLGWNWFFPRVSTRIAGKMGIV